MTPLQQHDDPLAALRERVTDDTIRNVNRVLQEGLFFYRKDQPILFSKLYDHRELFAQLWEHVNGIPIVVTPLYACRQQPTTDNDASSGFLNPRLTPNQRDLLAWTGPGMSMRTTVFLMFLKYAEEELNRREANADGERPFRYDEFYRYARDQFAAAAAAGGWPDPTTNEDSRLLQKSITAVFEKLEHFRFIELDRDEKVTTQQDKDRLPPGMDVVKFYQAMPSVYAYDTRALSQELMNKAFGGAPISSPPPQEDSTP